MLHSARLTLYYSLKKLRFLRRHLTDLNMNIQQSAGKCYGVTMNGLSMIETIKATGAEADFFAKWAGYKTKVLAASQDAALWSMSATVIPTLLGGINGALIMTLGGFSIMDGALTAGMFIAFQNLMTSFQAPVNALLGLGSTLQSTEMQLQRLNDVLHFPADPSSYSARFYSHLSGELQLKSVTFGYSPLDKPLITNFNLHLKPGRWVAIVGASGSGKSTIAKLVSGLYHIWAGDILFDGRARSDFDSTAFHNSVAAVDQDIFLFSANVRRNISLFDDSIPKADIIQAAKDACIFDDITALPRAFDTNLTEGGFNFSGGQRQRLEIARALAVNPSLLILDEATSALDPVTEFHIFQNIRRRACSCLIVAHRLSTIRDADEIIVLQRGQIIERGTHQQLLTARGYYFSLIQELDTDD